MENELELLNSTDNVVFKKDVNYIRQLYSILSYILEVANGPNASAKAAIQTHELFKRFVQVDQTFCLSIAKNQLLFDKFCDNLLSQYKEIRKLSVSILNLFEPLSFQEIKQKQNDLELRTSKFVGKCDMIEYLQRVEQIDIDFNNQREVTILLVHIKQLSETERLPKEYQKILL